MNLIKNFKLILIFFLNFISFLVIKNFPIDKKKQNIIYIFVENNHYREITLIKILIKLNINHILIYKNSPKYISEINSKYFILNNNFLFFWLFNKKKNYFKILLTLESYQSITYVLLDTKKTFYSIYDASFGRNIGFFYEFIEKLIIKNAINFIFRDPRFIQKYRLNKNHKNFLIILDSIGRHNFLNKKNKRSKKAISLGWIDGETCSIRLSLEILLKNEYEIFIQTSNFKEIDYIKRKYKKYIGNKIKILDSVDFNKLSLFDISIGICPHDNQNNTDVSNNDDLYNKLAGSSRLMDYIFMGLDIIVSKKSKFQYRISKISGSKVIDNDFLEQSIANYFYNDIKKLNSKLFHIDLYANKLRKAINEIN